MTTWVIFAVVILISLLIDLGLHANKKKPSWKSALGWSLFWILLAFGFNVWIYYIYGKGPGLDFLTSYIVEKALSVDNLFVFLVIFKTFHIPPAFRHKVLFWGVLGAILMRALFIAGGIALLSHFSFLFYIFGAFLIYTGIKLGYQKDKELHPEQSRLLLWIETWLPLDKNPSEHFFIQKNNKWFATPLFLALLTVECSDLLFALDSIPAVLGITTDPLIVYTSNIFAILGLRSLYFALEKTLDLFEYLHYGLALILVFIGSKMLLADIWHLPVSLSLSFILITLIISIIFSKIKSSRFFS